MIRLLSALFLLLLTPLAAAQYVVPDPCNYDELVEPFPWGGCGNETTPAQQQCLEDAADDWDRHGRDLALLDHAFQACLLRQAHEQAVFQLQYATYRCNILGDPAACDRLAELANEADALLADYQASLNQYIAAYHAVAGIYLEAVMACCDDSDDDGMARPKARRVSFTSDPTGPYLPPNPCDYDLIHELPFPLTCGDTTTPAQQYCIDTTINFGGCLDSFHVLDKAILACGIQADIENAKDDLTDAAYWCLFHSDPAACDQMAEIQAEINRLQGQYDAALDDYQDAWNHCMNLAMDSLNICCGNTAVVPEPEVGAFHPNLIAR